MDSVSTKWILETSLHMIPFKQLRKTVMTPMPMTTIFVFIVVFVVIVIIIVAAS
jgi:hypothetical protein